MLQAHFFKAVDPDEWDYIELNTDVPKEIDISDHKTTIEFPRRDGRGGSYIVVLPKKDDGTKEIRIVPKVPMLPTKLN